MLPGGTIPDCGGGVLCADAVAVVMNKPTTMHCHPRKENMMLPPFAALLDSSTQRVCLRSSKSKCKIEGGDAVRPLMIRCIEFHARVLPQVTPKIHHSHFVFLGKARRTGRTFGVRVLRTFSGDMSIVRVAESCGEGLLRIGMGAGLAWIGVVEGAGYGMFLQIVGGVFIAAGAVEIWEAGSHRRGLLRRPRFISHDAGATRAK
jgi:hypothetical protein